jgi:AraC family transcriptional regulator
MLLQSRFSTRLELREIADHVGVHPSHLCRAFHRYRNRTIGDYVLGLRMQFVCRTLIETSDSLSAISQAAGFTDQSHMTRIFKRVAGVSPGAYRRSLKSRHSLA